MVDRVQVAEVRIWNMLVGAVSWDEENRFAIFEFDPGFLEHGLDLSPIMMPIDEARRGAARFEFRRLPFETYKGLPGLLADALPDKFGNAIINQWLAGQGRTPESFSPVERLCYTGKRGMGALEFRPVINVKIETSVPVEVQALTELAQAVVDKRSLLQSDLLSDPSDAMLNIIRVGTSAGGTRPKAVIALNDKTGKVRSGQVAAPKGYDYWILKFDGVRDTSLGDPAGYGRIEYAYSLMAKAAGINMTECRLLEEGDRAHFMTRRFDRAGRNEKLHVQSLCAMAHFDFNTPGTHSYEEAFRTMRELRLPYKDAEQQYRRMVFNVVARNQDDHTKNIAFIMDKRGQWGLAPAFDVIYAYNPDGPWTHQHQMSIHGKRDGFTIADLLAVGKEMNIKSGVPIIEAVIESVSQWPRFASEAGVENRQIEAIGKVHRLSL